MYILQKSYPNTHVTNIPNQHLFLGECKGVGLVPRGNNDNHILVLILTEDDGDWFISESGFSSFWIEDLKEQLQAAADWMERHATKDPSGYGYCFNT